MPSVQPEMRAVLFDGTLSFTKNYPVPEVPPGWALVRVHAAGICKTDMELVKGYMDFNGVLGHEFIGTVQHCDNSALVGKRVVGEINAACGVCHWCKTDLDRHCPDRKVLGIKHLNGCMADYCVLPAPNLFEVPPAMSSDRAIFIEPLSAACEILEQLTIRGTEKVAVLGDGRIGILCAWVLATSVSDITLIGHHPEKLELAKWRHLKTAHGDSTHEMKADIVVDATGTGDGIKEALSFCVPRGIVVLKTTVASAVNISLAPIVIDEITVVGSRCGRFADGLRMLESHPDMPMERLITDRYDIAQAVSAFERSTHPEAVKVIIDMS